MFTFTEGQTPTYKLTSHEHPWVLKGQYILLQSPLNGWLCRKSCRKTNKYLLNLRQSMWKTKITPGLFPTGGKARETFLPCNQIGVGVNRCPMTFQTTIYMYLLKIMYQVKFDFRLKFFNLGWLSISFVS